MTASRQLHLTILALAFVLALRPHSQLRSRKTRSLFRCAENTSTSTAGNVTAIVHTASAFDPTAHKSCPSETA
jgi:hypothetical protein